MTLRIALRRLLTPLGGAAMLVAGSSLVLGLPAAQAVAPPSGSIARTLAAASDAVTTQVATEALDAVDPSTDAVEASSLTLSEFAQVVRSAGLLLSEDGTRILSTEAGLGSPRQLVLAQEAAHRFGIMKNPYFDPRRAAVVREGEAVVDLSTGVILGHPWGSALFGTTEVIPMDELEALRAQVGWNVTDARKDAAERYARLLGGYVPVAFQTDEAYARYLEAARSNYASMAA